MCLNRQIDPGRQSLCGPALGASPGPVSFLRRPFGSGDFRRRSSHRFISCRLSRLPPARLCRFHVNGRRLYSKINKQDRRDSIRGPWNAPGSVDAAAPRFTAAPHLRSKHDRKQLDKFQVFGEAMDRSGQGGRPTRGHVFRLIGSHPAGSGQDWKIWCIIHGRRRGKQNFSAGTGRASWTLTMAAKMAPSLGQTTTTIIILFGAVVQNRFFFFWSDLRNLTRVVCPSGPTLIELSRPAPRPVNPRIRAEPAEILLFPVWFMSFRRLTSSGFSRGGFIRRAPDFTFR